MKNYWELLAGDDGFGFFEFFKVSFIKESTSSPFPGEIRLVFVHCNKLMNNSGLETETDTGSNCSE